MIMGAFVQAAEEVETVKVKGMEVRIPIPAGYVGIDGVNEEFDRVKRSFLPATNRQVTRHRVGGGKVCAPSGSGVGDGTEHECSGRARLGREEPFREELWCLLERAEEVIRENGGFN